MWPALDDGDGLKFILGTANIRDNSSRAHEAAAVRLLFQIPLHALVVTEAHRAQADPVWMDQRGVVLFAPESDTRPGTGGVMILHLVHASITAERVHSGQRGEWVAVRFGIMGAARPLYLLGAYLRPDGSFVPEGQLPAADAAAIALAQMFEFAERCACEGAAVFIVGDLNAWVGIQPPGVVSARGRVLLDIMQASAFEWVTLNPPGVATHRPSKVGARGGALDLVITLENWRQAVAVPSVVPIEESWADHDAVVTTVHMPAAPSMVASLAPAPLHYRVRANRHGPIPPRSGMLVRYQAAVSTDRELQRVATLPPDEALSALVAVSKRALDRSGVAAIPRFTDRNKSDLLQRTITSLRTTIRRLQRARHAGASAVELEYLRRRRQELTHCVRALQAEVNSNIRSRSRRTFYQLVRQHPANYQFQFRQIRDAARARGVVTPTPGGCTRHTDQLAFIFAALTARYTGTQHRYQALNVNAVRPHLRPEALALRRQQIRNVLSASPDMDDDLNRPFTGLEVAAALRKLHALSATAGDLAGSDLKWIAGVGDVSDTTIPAITAFFNRVFREGLPAEWGRSLVKGLHKGGAVDIAKNWRWTASATSWDRVWQNLVVARLTDFCETFLPDTVCASRPGRSTDDAVLLLNSFCARMAVQGTWVFLCFVDIVTAFPTVGHDLVLVRANERGVSGHFWLRLDQLVSQFRLYAAGGLWETADVFLDHGLREGDAVSNPLFNLFLADLNDALRATCAGVRLAMIRRPASDVATARTCSDITFVDDLVAIVTDEAPHDMARIREKLDRVQLVLTTFAREYNLTYGFGPNKTASLAKAPAPSLQWTVDDVAVPTVERYRHLGFFQSTAGAVADDRYHKARLDAQVPVTRAAALAMGLGVSLHAASTFYFQEYLPRFTYVGGVVAQRTTSLKRDRITKLEYLIRRLALGLRLNSMVPTPVTALLLNWAPYRAMCARARLRIMFRCFDMPVADIRRVEMWLNLRTYCDLRRRDTGRAGFWWHHTIALLHALAAVLGEPSMPAGALPPMVAWFLVAGDASAPISTAPAVAVPERKRWLHAVELQHRQQWRQQASELSSLESIQPLLDLLQALAPFQFRVLGRPMVQPGVGVGTSVPRRTRRVPAWRMLLPATQDEQATAASLALLHRYWGDWRGAFGQVPVELGVYADGCRLCPVCKSAGLSVAHLLRDCPGLVACRARAYVRVRNALPRPMLERMPAQCPPLMDPAREAFFQLVMGLPPVAARGAEPPAFWAALAGSASAGKAMGHRMSVYHALFPAFKVGRAFLGLVQQRTLAAWPSNVKWPCKPKMRARAQLHRPPAVAV